MSAPARAGRLQAVLHAVVSTDHRVLGVRYLALSLLAVTVGTVLSVIMRVHLVSPDRVLPFFGVIRPEEYLALVTIHGTLMLFFVLTLAPQAGFGNLVLPSQIGATRMAFPALNAAGFWLTSVAFGVLLSSSLVQGGAAISGWTAYPPLSAIAAAGPGQGLGMDLWLVSIGLFSVGAIAFSVNLLTTVASHRCPGMTWARLPLTVWAWFTAAWLSVIALSVLLAALLLLFLDRHAGTSFYIPLGDLTNGTLHASGGGSPLLWLHLFWFFGHPEVYIAILPGMGLTSMLLANFSRRRVFGYGMMIVTTLLIGGLGILVWGHHLFVAGLNPFAGTAFSISTMAIALPSAAKVLSWLATTWGARPLYRTPMLWALGFVSLFVAGGLSGPILAQPILDQYLHNTYFVVAHFHLIMAMAGVFGLYAATTYWFPQISFAAGGKPRLLGEVLGRWHFWSTFVLAYTTFLPMHVAGLLGGPRHYAQLTGLGQASAALLAHTLGWQQFVSCSAMLLAMSQVLFVVNVILSLWRGVPAGENPWLATTLEWAPPVACDEQIAVTRVPCDYGSDDTAATLHPQWDIRVVSE